MKKNKVVVHLVGGLGNQLYGYFAGAWLANKVNLELQLDLSEIASHHSASTVESFALDCRTFRNPARLFLRRTFLGKISDSIIYRVGFIRRLADSVFRIYRETPGELFEFSQSDLSINFGGGVHLRGFFPSDRYFFEVVKAIPHLSQLRLKNPSEIFLSLSNQIETARPIVIHLRRGDYDSLRSTYGVLSAVYYRKALRHLLPKSETKVVWIFSNDGSAAKSFVKAMAEDVEFEQVEFRYIHELEESDAAESMLLMSKGFGNIIANSTFSHWSALLGNQGGRVVYPDEYSRTGQAGQVKASGHQTLNWHGVQSSWLDEGTNYA